MGDVEVSQAMAGHAEAICQMLFGHVVGFVSQSALPQKHQDFKWVLASYVGSMWGSNARIEATVWAQIGAKFGHLAAKLGDLEGKLGYREVMLKLSWAMLCHVEYMSDFVRPCCWFCIQKCFLSSRTKILSGFLPAMLAPLGVKYGYLVAMLALLAPSCDQLRPSRGP